MPFLTKGGQPPKPARSAYRGLSVRALLRRACVMA